MIRRAVAIAGIVAATVCFVASAAPAQPPDARGWWWAAGSPLGLAPPFVPEDGLYVASNPSGPEAIAALRFTVAGGGGAGTLRLDVAGETRGTVVVGVCPLADDWEPVQAGSIAEAPACDAEGPTVPGTPAEDGLSVSFPVGALVRGGVLNVGVVPGVDETGANPTFQLPLEKPGPDALTAADDGGSGGSAPFTPTDGGSFTPTPAPASPPMSFEPLPPSAPLAPQAAPPAPPAPAGSGQTPLDPAAQPASSSDDGQRGWRLAGFALLAATAVAYHRLSTTPDRAPQSLVTFGSLAGKASG